MPVQSRPGPMQAPSTSESQMEEGLLGLRPTSHSPAEQSYSSILSAKRRRWESTGSESPLGSGMEL